MTTTNPPLDKATKHYLNALLNGLFTTNPYDLSYFENPDYSYWLIEMKKLTGHNVKIWMQAADNATNIYKSLPLVQALNDD